MKPHVRRSLTSISAVALAAVLAHLVGASAQFAGANPPPPNNVYDPYRGRASVTLPVTIRDFQPAGGPGGHPDFYNTAAGGNARYARIAADTLASDAKPVFFSTGYKVLADWHDSAGHPVIDTRSYIDAVPGDFAGSMSGSTGGAVTSAANFAQWFRDTPGVNTSTQRTLAMAFDSSSSSYVFDGSLDSWPGGGVNDFNYSLDMNADFLYERGRAWYVSVGTTGDAFLYVDDKQVVDLGSGISVTSGVSGVVVNGAVTMNSSSQINPVLAGGEANVTTMGTAVATVNMGSSTRITGNVRIGVGGNTATTIFVDPSATITGTRTALTAPLNLPALPPIPNVGPSVGDRIYGTDTTLSSDLHCNNLQVIQSWKLFISGNRIIVCDSAFSLIQSSQLQLLPNSSLTLYCRGFNTSSSSRFNTNTANAALATIYVYGAVPFTTASSTGVYANALAPQANFSMSGSSKWYGNVFANSINMGNSAQFWVQNTGAWGPPSGGAGPGMSAMQRIDLDRLAWLTDGHTHKLRLFFANRTAQPSRLRVETNMTLLRVAALPWSTEND